MEVLIENAFRNEEERRKNIDALMVVCRELRKKYERKN